MRERVDLQYVNHKEDQYYTSLIYIYIYSVYIYMYWIKGHMNFFVNPFVFKLFLVIYLYSAKAYPIYDLILPLFPNWVSLPRNKTVCNPTSGLIFVQLVPHSYQLAATAA